MRVGIITRDAFAHVSAVGICTGILFLFVALTYSRITLPRYTTDYTEKDVQQVVNLIIAVVATVVGILFSHCRRYVKSTIPDSKRQTDILLALPTKQRPGLNFAMRSLPSLDSMCTSRLA